MRNKDLELFKVISQRLSVILQDFSNVFIYVFIFDWLRILNPVRVAVNISEMLFTLVGACPVKRAILSALKSQSLQGSGVCSPLHDYSEGSKAFFSVLKFRPHPFFLWVAFSLLICFGAEQVHRRA